MFEFAAPQASVAGIFTSIASVITALTVLIGAAVGGLKVLLPMLREVRHNTESLKQQDAKLNVIHTLVNSTLTAALQSELDATRREELLLRELMRMRSEAGHGATDDQTAALGAVQRKIRELTAAMEERAKQTRVADIQIETESQREASKA